MSAAKDSLYNVDEKILAFYGPLLYSAKILKVDAKNGKLLYNIHYIGWSSKYDDWVEEDCLRKYTEENESLASILKDRLKRSKSGPSVKRKELESSESTNSSSSKKSNSSRKPAIASKTAADTGEVNEDSHEEAHEEATPPELNLEYDEVKGVRLNIKLHGNLKKYLLLDWENVTIKSELLQIPRKPAVVDVLAEYVALKDRTDIEQAQVEELASGLRHLFDRALSASLLYKFERPQYMDYSKAYPAALPSSFYGAEHLLRLFVKLPSLLVNVRMDAAELQVMQLRINDLLKWLQGVPHFVTDYMPADKDYRRRVNS